MENEMYLCSQCGVELNEEECFHFGENIYCRSCLSEETVVCIHCGERILNEDNRNTRCDPVCSYCFSDHYTYCYECDRVISYDESIMGADDNDYCPECYDRIYNRAIHNYSFKPEPIFYGEANRYFGVELEIDRGGELEENARELLDIGNREKEHIYIKHDGSLNDGMEIVTHPMTLDYHIKNMNWDEIAKKALSMDYRSHKTSTCGFHIHVNRSSFSDTYAEREERIANVFYIVEKFWDRFLIFSRRTADQLAQWASRYGCGTAPKDVYKNVKENYYGRYKCINDQNDATIEFRIFRGTLRTNTIIATLQMVNEICNVAVSMSEKELQELTWDEFVDRLGIYPELMVYMHERGLVNMERVQEEE